LSIYVAVIPIGDYSQHFSVDMADFTFDKYFIAEGLDLFGIGALFDRVFRGKPFPQKPIPLTLGELFEAAQRGKW